MGHVEARSADRPRAPAVRRVSTPGEPHRRRRDDEGETEHERESVASPCVREDPRRPLEVAVEQRLEGAEPQSFVEGRRARGVGHRHTVPGGEGRDKGRAARHAPGAGSSCGRGVLREGRGPMARRAGADTAHRPVPPSRWGAPARRANLRAVDAQFLTIIGTVLAVGFGLAGLMIRTTARLDRRIDNDKAAADADRRAYQSAADTDRRAYQSAADADRRAYQTATDADRHAYQAATDADRRALQSRFDTAMDAFRTEMQRLAERQSHVEGRVAEREAAAD